ncbi:Adhesion G-protein coupled receptor D1 [Acropora cervicornis]|uniref:Adhesion G-protein coupled receptor D1 n=1 Tax=Acropora cervicornis TaxID=6130 RepID=A0AAD9QQ03_ACRCE|nr:Adhesion G-protein coupled receptor D1 [Acropora cervicornis]
MPISCPAVMRILAVLVVFLKSIVTIRCSTVSDYHDKVYRELWTGISGIAVADLVSNDRFPCDPTESKFIDTFCIYHTQNRNHYGQRLRSFFRAPESGNYQFQTSCNYACQLWMSDDEQVSKKRLIVNQKKIAVKFSFDRNSDQTSKTIYLRKGKLYYMELLHKERVSPGFICVGAKFPTLNRERPVSSRHLVMNETELGLIGCQRNGTFFDNVKCATQFCYGPQQKLKTFKSSMDILMKKLALISADRPTSSQRQLTEIGKAGTQAINEVLKDKKKHLWRESNSSLTIQIAEVTELFGKELASRWSNETTDLSSFQSNIVNVISSLFNCNFKDSIVPVARDHQDLDTSLSALPDNIELILLGDFNVNFTGSNLNIDKAMKRKLIQVTLLSSTEYVFSAPKEDENWDEIDDFVNIKMLGAANDSQSKVKAFSVIYRTLHQMLPSTLNKIASDKGNESGGFHLNSRVVGSLVTTRFENKTFDVIVTLQHVKYRSNATLTPVCVWWDFKAGGESSSGMWSRNGCTFDTFSSNETHSICKCNHLTNFAVLMKVTEGEESIAPQHEVALEIITYVGCALSLAGFAKRQRGIFQFEVLTTSPPNYVTRSPGYSDDLAVICKVVAVWLHYFLLVWFAWMLIEGIYLYLMVITVFDNNNEQLRLYGVCAYGIPGVIVLISASSAHEGYGTDSSCWLSVTNGVIYAFVVPALLIILMNTVILGLVIREIIRIQTNGVSNATKFDLIKSGLKSITVLFPLLGITWIFGVLALGNQTIVFQYLFALCNSLQGLFIFIFHCLCNSEIRRAFQRKREIWSNRKTSLIFWPSSLQASSAKSTTPPVVASNSSVLNARLLSVEESNSRVNMGPVEPSQQPRESSIAHEQADTTTNQVTTDEAQTAWLAKDIGPGPPKVKLPPVSTKTSSKKKKRRNSKEQPRKGKANRTIEPVKEETEGEKLQETEG